MNKVLYIIIMGLLFSCKSNSIAQEKENEEVQQKPKVERPKFKDLQNNTIDPNMVHLVSIMQSVNKNKAICGKTYTTTATIKVDRIVNIGSGIVNMVSPGQIITVGFMNFQEKELETLKQIVNKNKEVFLKIKEDLCPDMSNTVYEVLQFESKG
ncbi:hypothetical protein [Aquimarina sediminis]|uniref:hypothetical protein n=1 Tax=Aquimarina sediminis TaxID=2070536 RepID=UPI000CA012B4|nr:hypothetical protein [Aquimarina sediminis]